MHDPGGPFTRKTPTRQRNILLIEVKCISPLCVYFDRNNYAMLREQNVIREVLWENILTNCLQIFFFMIAQTHMFW